MTAGATKSRPPRRALPAAETARNDTPDRGLENIANNSGTSKGKRRSDLRKRRFRGREVNWGESRLKRCRDCGRVAITKGGSVAVRQSPGFAGFAGLSTCGSVWSCGVCNAKIMARRQLDIGMAVELWKDQGGRVLFGTMTMRHWTFHRLDDLWGSVSKAWANVTCGRNWLLNKKRYGIAGWLRVVEVTFGDNGWHVHIHYLVFLEAPIPSTEIDALRDSMFGRWAGALHQLGMPAPLPVGQDLHQVDGTCRRRRGRATWVPWWPT